MHSPRLRETIQEATSAYETWLAEHTRLVPGDLTDKHARMAADRFAFFRATYYRWAQRWSALSSDLSSAPAVLAVGDLHIENFGTWRDSEGRLVWGINDFDEASTLPYTNDLVRLATSALLAIEGDHLGVRPRPACTALLDGYRAGLEAGGRPFVLNEEHPWLRRVANRRLRDAARFWKRLDHSSTPRSEPPPEARMALDLALPERDLPYRVHARVAGEGSLGLQRWVAVCSWRGARIAREAKARAPSASFWCAADGAPGSGGEDPYAAIVGQAVRAHDPFLRIGDRWLMRRLAPDCSRVDLGSLPDRRDEPALLEAMGWETANIHMGTPEVIPAVVEDLQQRSGDWLLQAGRAMLRAEARDWKAYRAISS